MTIGGTEASEHFVICQKDITNGYIKTYFPTENQRMGGGTGDFLGGA